MPRFAANLSYLFAERPLLDRFAAAAAAGFKAVEVQFPYVEPKEAVAERLAATGLKMVLQNVPPGREGDRGLACLPDRRQEFLATIEHALDYAVALKTPRLHCMAGTVPAGADPFHLRRTYVENIRLAAKLAGRVGVTINIEPLNTRDNPGYFLTHSHQAAALLDEIGAANVALQYDVYHMQIMEGDLVPTIKRLLPRIGHIQIADTPGRHEPGTGEINYPFVLSQIDAMGYDGWVGCEYRPKTTTEESLRWLAPWLKRA
ncbi:MAG: 2-oxo-tetronate isomerase [Alphaproteobacteria bacterium]